MRGLGALVLLALVPCYAVSQERPPNEEQTRPDGLEAEAARAVDRFVEALNARDRDGVVASFAPDATVSRFNWLVEEFLRADAAASDYYTWMVETPGWSYELQVVDRVVSGSFVFQRERLEARGPDGRGGVQAQAVLYGVRDGLVHSVRPLPAEVDPAAVPEVVDPRFPRGAGPVVMVDAAHFNHHRPESSYWPFVELLRRDGYVVRTWASEFREATLDSAGVDVLVIANATSEKNAREPIGGWQLPTPSAFSEREIAELEAWVRAGGALLLVADHLPWGGAAADLAAVFGVEFRNGFARDTSGPLPDAFRREDGSLVGHPITDGSSAGERVESVATFTGQAFRRMEGAAGGTRLEPLLVLSDSWVLVQPAAAGRVTADSPRIPVAGWWQGAAGRHGRGRVALFGEAAMFRILTEQGGLPPGHENARLTRNVVAWLSAGS